LTNILTEVQQLADWHLPLAHAWHLRAIQFSVTRGKTGKILAVWTQVTATDIVGYQPGRSLITARISWQTLRRQGRSIG
jgi:hypothetical protein